MSVMLWLSSLSPIFNLSLLFGLLVVALLTKLCLQFNSRKSETHAVSTIRKTNSFELPPGPKPWPLVGNLPEMLINMIIMKRRPHRWIHALMNQLQTDIACIRLWNIHVIPVRSPEIAKEFLRKHDAMFSSRPLNMTTGYASRGFLTTILAPEGEQWKKMRRLVSAHVIQPATKLRLMREKREQEADNLVRFIYNQCKTGPSVIDVRLAIWQFCGNVTRKMLFNRRYFGAGSGDGGPGFEEVEHVEAAFNVVANIYALSPSDYSSIFRWLDLDGHGKTVRECMRNLTKHQDRIIDERVKQWRDGDKNEPEDLLDFFILAKDPTGQPLSAEEIKAQFAELLFASMDNPANNVEWVMVEMINQPDILRKAIEEIDKVVGKDRLVQESDLPSLPYIKACAKEAFRLHPIAPFLPPHISTTDTNVSGYFIPKGSHVLLSRVDLGRNPKVWDDPHQFKPSRHLKEDSGKLEITEPGLKFISFSKGKRECVGNTLGSIMIMMLLARLLQGFSWRVPTGKKESDLTVSSNGLLLLNKPLHAQVDLRLRASLYPTN